MPTRILVVDDHALIRMATEQLIKMQPDLQCVGSCSDLEEADVILEREPVDVAVCDLQFKMGNALSFISASVAKRATRFLVSSAHRAEVYTRLCAHAGASEYIHKSADPDRLLDAIRRVAASSLEDGFLGELPEIADNDRTHRLLSLSSREWEVLTQIGHGLATKEIAKNLFLSAKTVESHRASLKRKLDIDSKDFLVSYAAELCLGGT